jgi:hypothetical protein|tara:strand:+ start:471 stop:680 length:210 start_codon:yes stop_codon:yes gene_type:complete
MNGWVSEMPRLTEIIAALATIIGSVGAAVAISRTERRLSVENERLKDDLLRWRILAVLLTITGTVGWLL